MREQIQQLLKEYDDLFVEIQKQESWQWAMNEMSYETNEKFNDALQKIEKIRALVDA